MPRLRLLFALEGQNASAVEAESNNGGPTARKQVKMLGVELGDGVVRNHLHMLLGCDML